MDEEKRLAIEHGCEGVWCDCVFVCACVCARTRQHSQGARALACN